MPHQLSFAAGAARAQATRPCAASCGRARGARSPAAPRSANRPPPGLHVLQRSRPAGAHAHAHWHTRACEMPGSMTSGPFFGPATTFDSCGASIRASVSRRVRQNVAKTTDAQKHQGELRERQYTLGLTGRAVCPLDCRSRRAFRPGFRRVETQFRTWACAAHTLRRHRCQCLAGHAIATLRAACQTTTGQPCATDNSRILVIGNRQST